MKVLTADLTNRIGFRVLGYLTTQFPNAYIVCLVRVKMYICTSEPNLSAHRPNPHQPMQLDWATHSYSRNMPVGSPASKYANTMGGEDAMCMAPIIRRGQLNLAYICTSSPRKTPTIDACRTAFSALCLNESKWQEERGGDWGPGALVPWPRGWRAGTSTSSSSSSH